MRAISWLNEGAGADFYLVKIEGIRIGTSLPAPLLTLIVGPSEESREVGEVKKERAERYGVRRKFWTGLLERAKERTRLHSAVSPGEYGWLGAGSGKSGLGFNYTIGQHRGSVELYIDRGKDADDENMSIFQALADHREEIEAAYGGELSWEPLEGKRACRITERFDVGGYRDEGALARNPRSFGRCDGTSREGPAPTHRASYAAPSRYAVSRRSAGSTASARRVPRPLLALLSRP